MSGISVSATKRPPNMSEMTLLRQAPPLKVFRDSMVCRSWFLVERRNLPHSAALPQCFSPFAPWPENLNETLLG